MGRLMERVRGFLAAACAALVLSLPGCGGGSGGSSSSVVNHAIALTSTPEVGLSTVSPTGSVSAPLIPEAGDAFFSAYALSKSGRIAYGIVSAHAPRTHTFYVANANGGNPQQVVSTPVTLATLSSVVWSPDETELAYVLPDASGVNVYRVSIATGVSTPVTTENDVDLGGSLAWSPTGELYFVRGAGTARTIWKTPVAGGTPVQLTTTPGTLPSLSPNGTKLSFINPTDDNRSATTIYERDLVSEQERTLLTASAGVFLNAGYLNSDTKILYTHVLSFNPADIFVGQLNTTTLQTTESPAPTNVFVSAIATPGSGVPQVVF
jgi:Tol biopolymer transport system component